MMKITYHDANQQKTATFENMADFIMLQMREVPALEDNLTIDQLEISGEKVDFTGSVLDLFNAYLDKI
ncbi:DUF4649 family protein [Lactococcus sp.]|uniref:DUF4649 family protein n=1 Tax=Lactococcus sp. TaxID=44273 RepID=UPI0035ADBB6C